jgi:hypothetical protein
MAIAGDDVAALVDDHAGYSLGDEGSIGSDVGLVLGRHSRAVCT